MYSFRISWYNEKIEVRIPELSKLLAERRQKLNSKHCGKAKTAEKDLPPSDKTETSHEGTFREQE